MIENIQKYLLEERDKILNDIEISPIKNQISNFDSFNSTLDELLNNL